MKHMRSRETILVLMIYFFASYLIFAPVMIDIILAQSMDSTPPVLAHNPIKFGYRGKPLKITANIGDDSKIQSASITIQYGGKSITGNFPPRKDLAVVPVLAQAQTDLVVYAGPGSQYAQRGSFFMGDQFFITGQKQNYYQVYKSTNIKGYVEAVKVSIVMTGQAYGVSLPPSITNQSELSYQISVTDINGNTTVGDLTRVRLLTEDEIDALLAEKSGGTLRASAKSSAQPEGTKKSSFTPVLIFGGLALVGGGVYYLLTQHKTKEEDVPVDVIIGWD